MNEYYNRIIKIFTNNCNNFDLEKIKFFIKNDVSGSPFLIPKTTKNIIMIKKSYTY